MGLTTGIFYNFVLLFLLSTIETAAANSGSLRRCFDETILEPSCVRSANIGAMMVVDSATNINECRKLCLVNISCEQIVFNFTLSKCYFAPHDVLNCAITGSSLSASEKHIWAYTIGNKCAYLQNFNPPSKTSYYMARRGICPGNFKTSMRPAFVARRASFDEMIHTCLDYCDLSESCAAFTVSWLPLVDSNCTLIRNVSCNATTNAVAEFTHRHPVRRVFDKLDDEDSCPSYLKGMWSGFRCRYLGNDLNKFEKISEGTTTCLFGYYPQNRCDLKCRCRDQGDDCLASEIEGNCSASGCAAGFSGLYCDQECKVPRNTRWVSRLCNKAGKCNASLTWEPPLRLSPPFSYRTVFSGRKSSFVVIRENLTQTDLTISPIEAGTSYELQIFTVCRPNVLSKAVRLTLDLSGNTVWPSPSPADSAYTELSTVAACPCLNSGYCVQRRPVKCLCPPSFTGKFCNYPITVELMSQSVRQTSQLISWKKPEGTIHSTVTWKLIRQLACTSTPDNRKRTFTQVTGSNVLNITQMLPFSEYQINVTVQLPGNTNFSGSLIATTTAPDPTPVQLNDIVVAFRPHTSRLLVDWSSAEMTDPLLQCVDTSKPLYHYEVKILPSPPSYLSSKTTKTSLTMPSSLFNFCSLYELKVGKQMMTGNAPTSMTWSASVEFGRCETPQPRKFQLISRSNESLQFVSDWDGPTYQCFTNSTVICTGPRIPAIENGFSVAYTTQQHLIKGLTPFTLYSCSFSLRSSQKFSYCSALDRDAKMVKAVTLPTVNESSPVFSVEDSVISKRGTFTIGLPHFRKTSVPVVNQSYIVMSLPIDGSSSSRIRRSIQSQSEVNCSTKDFHLDLTKAVLQATLDQGGSFTIGDNKTVAGTWNSPLSSTYEGHYIIVQRMFDGEMIACDWAKASFPVTRKTSASPNLLWIVIIIAAVIVLVFVVILLAWITYYCTSRKRKPAAEDKVHISLPFHSPEQMGEEDKNAEISSSQVTPVYTYVNKGALDDSNKVIHDVLDESPLEEIHMDDDNNNSDKEHSAGFVGTLKKLLAPSKSSPATERERPPSHNLRSRPSVRSTLTLCDEWSSDEDEDHVNDLDVSRTSMGLPKRTNLSSPRQNPMAPLVEVDDREHNEHTISDHASVPSSFGTRDNVPVLKPPSIPPPPPPMTPVQLAETEQIIVQTSPSSHKPPVPYKPKYLSGLRISSPPPTTPNHGGSFHFDGNAAGIIQLGELIHYLPSPYNYQRLQLLKSEFEQIPNLDHTHSTDVANLPANLSKNRFPNVLPYDRNRVKLSASPTIGYINASFIDGYHGARFYIAAQDPLENTVFDFWRMVLQQEVQNIIMLSSLSEHQTKQYYQYWPSNQNAPLSLKDNEGSTLTVKLTEQRILSDFTVLEFVVSLKDKGPAKQKLHIVKLHHFTAWPDHRSLPHSFDLVNFWLHYRSIPPVPPVLVHCSSGSGRTGAFIALDILFDQAHAEGAVNPSLCVTKLRQNSRPLMIQTVEQYLLLYVALVEIAGGNTDAVNTCMTVAELPSVVASMQMEETADDSSECEESARLTTRERLFQLINAKTPHPIVNENSTAMQAENRSKNRFPGIVPSDEDRIVLRSDSTGRGDYINACFADGYRSHNAYILCQTPLHNTVTDFLRLIWQQRPHVIVMMHQIQTSEIIATVPYWPSSRNPVFKSGPFKVEIIEKEINTATYTERRLRITLETAGTGQDASMEVTQLQLKRWRSDVSIPVNSSELVILFSAMENSLRGGDSDYFDTDSSIVEHDAPVLIHCSDGATRSGLFLAVANAIEMLRLEQQIDIVQVIKRARFNRPHIIVDGYQFMHCYEAVCQYVQGFEPYANFK